MKAMKAITLWPEWCFCICRLDKIVENRTWKPPEALIGQRIAIHAGKNIGGVTSYKKQIGAINLMSEEAERGGWLVERAWGSHRFFHVNGHRGEQSIALSKDDIHTSAIVATAVLAQCTREFYGETDGVIVSGSENLMDVAPMVRKLGWQAEGQYHWLLEDVRVLGKPIPMKGKMGFWEAGNIGDDGKGTIEP